MNLHPKNMARFQWLSVYIDLWSFT